MKDATLFYILLLHPPLNHGAQKPRHVANRSQTNKKKMALYCRETRKDSPAAARRRRVPYDTIYLPRGK